MSHRNEEQQKQALGLKSELQHFSGDLERYRHPLNRRVIYTPGVQHLAEQAGAYWLVDAIASWMGSPPFNKALQENGSIRLFHVWNLEVSSDQSAVLTAYADTTEPPYAKEAFIIQKIPLTDFLFDEFNLWVGFDGQHWTIYLPSEH